MTEKVAGVLRKNRISRAAIAISCPLLLAASACSGDGSGSSTAASSTVSSSTAAASFREQATAICERGAHDAAQIPAPDTLVELEQVVERVRPLNDRLNNEVEALRPPPELQDDFDSLVALFDDDERFLVQLGEAAAARDQAAANEAATKYEAVGREEDRLWRLLGVPACTEIRLGEQSI